MEVAFVILIIENKGLFSKNNGFQIFRLDVELWTFFIFSSKKFF